MKNDTKVELLEGFPPEGRITVGDYLVPHLSAVTMDGGIIMVILDRRYEILVPRDEFDRWLWFVANCMAVAAGYSSFGERSREANAYRLLYTCFAEAPEPPTTPTTPSV